MKHIFDHHNWMLTTLNQSWVISNFLEQYCQVIYYLGAPSQIGWGCVKETMVNMCIPGNQSVVNRNGLMENLFGPIEGRKRNTTMLRKC